MWTHLGADALRCVLTAAIGVSWRTGVDAVILWTYISQYGCRGVRHRERVMPSAINVPACWEQEGREEPSMRTAPLFRLPPCAGLPYFRMEEGARGFFVPAGRKGYLPDWLMQSWNETTGRREIWENRGKGCRQATWHDADGRYPYFVLLKNNNFYFMRSHIPDYPCKGQMTRDRFMCCEIVSYEWEAGRAWGWKYLIEFFQNGTMKNINSEETTFFKRKYKKKLVTGVIHMII